MIDRKMRRLVRTLPALLLLPAGIPSAAQGLAFELSSGTHEAAGEDRSPLETSVSIQATGISLGDALASITEQTGSGLVFSSNLVPVTRTVSLDLDEVRLGEALTAVLAGTEVDFRIDDSGHVVLVRRAETPRTADRQGTISGRVLDAATLAPLAGAQIVVDGTGRGTLAGPDGRFQLADIPAGTHTVTASMIGYTRQQRTVELAEGQTATVEFALEQMVIALEGIVAVGYGTQEKATLTGSVAVVSGEELEAAPASNLSNSISGKLPGVVTVNSSGEPGADGATIRIRGSHTLNDNSPLVVIDGVPGRAGGLERLNPQDIESISVLKDASAAIYGSRAANGVILVTTKRGRSGEPTLTLNFNQGFNQPTRLPEMADAATYMEMLNEIDLYREREPRYTEEEIQNHRIGADPWLYPDTDWFGEVIKPVSLQTRGDVSLSGGGDRFNYYLSLGGRTEDGYYRNSATRYNQYSFRSNIDGRVTDYLDVRFDLSGRLEDRNYPNRNGSEVFRALMRGKPNLPGYWPNGKPGPDIEFGDNPVVIGTPETGYSRDERYFLQSTLGLDFQVPGVEGLAFRANASYDQLFRYQKQWRTPWTLYIWDYRTRDENGVPVLEPAHRGYSTPELRQLDSRDNDILLNLVGEYRRDYGDHTVGVLGGIERQTSDNSSLTAFRKYFTSDQIDQMFAGGDAEKDNGGSAGLARRQNYFTRINYDYQDKYLVEFVGRYDGSYIFPEEKRFGFFPAVSLGWRLTEESFFQDALPVFDDLKLRGSWGQTGNDRIDQWQYLATYGYGDGYVFGREEVKSVYQTRTPNPNVTWEVANQLNIGVDAVLLDNRLSLTADYFKEQRDNILWWRNASVPQMTGLNLPRENIGEVASWGYDGSISWADALSQDFSYDVTFTGGYAQNEIRFWDETPGAPAWQRSTGSRMDTELYYDAIGVFANEAALDQYPHWPGARPGDIIFRDVNEDGQITADDRIRVNQNDQPTFTGGLTFGLRMNRFDATIFFQGASGAVQYLATESGEIGNFLQAFAENRWTPENPSSEHPRTFNRTEEYWMTNENTYFLHDTDYVRLKTLELGYRLPTSWTGGLGMDGMRVYVSGFNLLTWDKFKLMDPEARSERGQFYPQKRVFNLGTSITF